MPSTIIDVGDPSTYQYITTTDNDFAYLFDRGASRWAFLMQFPNDVGLIESPSVFRSSDGGASYSLQDSAGAPIANRSGQTSINYDSRFNYIDPSTKVSISAIYANDDSIPTYDFHVADFNLDLSTWGSPYAPVSIVRYSTGRFSSRPDGTLMFVYTREDSGHVPVGTFYQIYAGGWGGEITISASTTARIQNLAVDPSGQAHVVLSDHNYYRIDAGGSVVQTASVGGAAGFTGNLTIVGDNLHLGYFDTFGSAQIMMATGTPLSGPSWSTETVAAETTARHYVWIQSLSGSYAFAVEQFDDYDYVVESSGYSASGLTAHWPATDSQSVHRSIRTAGVWSAPDTIWTVDVFASGLLSLAVRIAAGVGPANRYRPIFIT